MPRPPPQGGNGAGKAQPVSGRLGAQGGPTLGQKLFQLSGGCRAFPQRHPDLRACLSFVAAAQAPVVRAGRPNRERIGECTRIGRFQPSSRGGGEQDRPFEHEHEIPRVDE